MYKAIKNTYHDFTIRHTEQLKHERCKQMIRKDTYSLVKSKWNEFEDVKDNNFKPLVDTIVNSGKSFHILGRAGT